MTLKEKYKDYFKIGTAVNRKTIATHKELIVKHFNSITCENEMKFGSLCPVESTYNFDSADTIRDFANEHEISLRGHTLVWHNQTPAWVFEDTDRDHLLERMKKHITKVGGHYRNNIDSWDVVNEAIEDKADGILRESKWFQIIGEDFIDQAFHTAKEVVPEAVLYYNDYSETKPVKRDKIYKVLKGMIDRGVPVEGMGMQFHGSLYHPCMDDVKRSIELYASLNLRIQITEMDISLFGHEDHSHLEAPTKELLSKQAEVYKNCFQIFREYKDVIDCVTIWGVADDSNWLSNFPVRGRKNWPLLFDDNHEPKEAFFAIMDF